MATQYAKFGLATVLAAGIGLAVPAQHASAGQDPGNGKGQETTQADPTNTKIDLDLESSNLYYGLKLLFSQIKANFTIDESLKSLTVTAHLSQVPFRVALETLLKSTSTPLTYKVENGIYSVVPKVEEAPPERQATDQTFEPKGGGGYKYGIIHPANLSATDLVTAFGGNIVNIGYDKNAASYGSGGLGGGSGGGMGSGLGGGSNFGSGGLGSGSSSYGSSYGSRGGTGSGRSGF